MLTAAVPSLELLVVAAPANNDTSVDARRYVERYGALMPSSEPEREPLVGPASGPTPLLIVCPHPHSPTPVWGATSEDCLGVRMYALTVVVVGRDGTLW